MRRRARADHRRRSEPLRPRPLPAPPPPLRPARGVALVRAELAVATGDGLARRRRRSEVDPRRRDRAPPASRSRSAAAPGHEITGIDITEAMLRQGHDARPARAGAADRVQLVVGQAERLPFPDADVRRADVHLSPALRRRSRGDDVRAGSRARAGRRDREPGVRGAAHRVLALLVVVLHARRVAGCGLSHRRARVGPGRCAFSVPTSPRTTGATRSTGPSRRGRTRASWMSAFGR